MIKRTAKSESIYVWHHKLGHPSADALDRLDFHTPGFRIKGPKTVQCGPCGQTKVKSIINRAPCDRGERRAERITVDLHDLRRGYGGSVAIMLFTNQYAGLIWDYYLSEKSAGAAQNIESKQASNQAYHIFSHGSSSSSLAVLRSSGRHASIPLTKLRNISLFLPSRKCSASSRLFPRGMATSAIHLPVRSTAALAAVPPALFQRP